MMTAAIMEKWSGRLYPPSIPVAGKGPGLLSGKHRQEILTVFPGGPGSVSVGLAEPEK